MELDSNTFWSVPAVAVVAVLPFGELLKLLLPTSFIINVIIFIHNFKIIFVFKLTIFESLYDFFRYSMATFSTSARITSETTSGAEPVPFHCSSL